MLINADAVPSPYRSEVNSAMKRAQAIGAPEKLEFMGMGEFGVVLCDEEGNAYKVFRHAIPLSDKHRLFIEEALADEYEWLVAAKEAGISEHVVAAYAAYPKELVLVRECVQGWPGGWAQGRELGKLHKEIEDAMIPVGWNSPEFKEDSYIYPFPTELEPEPGPKLVDISMVQRLGDNLAQYVEDVLDGKRRSSDTWHTLAFFVLREMREAPLPTERAKELLDRLVERDPTITKGFTLPT